MSARGRTQLICSVLLGSLAISCSAPPVHGAPQPVPQDAQQQVDDQQPVRGGEQQVPDQPALAEPQQPVEQQQPAEHQQQPPRAAQPEPGTANQSKPSTGVQSRPSGDPPGINNSLPTITADYAQKADWEKSRRKACKDALGPGHDNCITFQYQWFEETEPGKFGTGHAISDPTPDYQDPPYATCQVEKMNPPSGHPVPAGTVITIKIGCSPPRQQAQSDDNQNTVNTNSQSNTQNQQKTQVENQHNHQQTNHQQTEGTKQHKNQQTQGTNQHN